MTKQYSRTRTMVEGALMLALASVLSMIPLYSLPHGGTITVVSTLPIILFSLRHGVRWGLAVGFIHSLLQLLFLGGLENLAYCQTLGAQIGCVLLDYVLAYTLLGLAWLIAKPFKKRVLGVGVATVVVSLIRYLCSFLSGYVVWKDYDYAFEWMTNFGWGQAIANMGENALCWLYSAVYNATYMIPEAILTAVVAVVLCATVPMLFQEQK